MKLHYKIIRLYFYLTSLLLVVSCSSNDVYIKPPSTGKIGDLVVIVDRVYWDSELGDSLRAIFNRPYPMLPQNEKSFNLLSMPYSAFNPSMQKHRNIIMVNISSENTEAKVLKLYDSWAKPQIVVHVVGPDAQSVSTIMSEKKETLLSIFEQAECMRQSENAIRYEDPEIRKAIEKKFGVRLCVPNGYTILGQRDDFIWMESRTNRANQGIIIYSYPYTDANTFTQKFLTDKRDYFLHKYVHGQRDSSWMRTSKYIQPTFKLRKDKEEQTYAELRGLWEVENDYMGGPFVSRTFLDQKAGKIMTVEGYVYAPQSDKRDYLRRVEGIVNTFSFNLDANFNQKGSNVKDKEQIQDK